MTIMPTVAQDQGPVDTTTPSPVTPSPAGNPAQLAMALDALAHVRQKLAEAERETKRLGRQLVRRDQQLRDRGQRITVALAVLDRADPAAGVTVLAQNIRLVLGSHRDPVGGANATAKQQSGGHTATLAMILLLVLVAPGLVGMIGGGR